MEPTATVYKICARAAWEEACRAGAFAGSADDRRDGFIHLSARHQLAGTAARHFRGEADLVLVAFEAARLGPKLAWEPSRGGDLFPHLYGDLPTSAALWTRPLELGSDGLPVLPEEL
jgi:uncharacterized protein (DUF952 family)